MDCEKNNFDTICNKKKGIYKLYVRRNWAQSITQLPTLLSTLYIF